MLLWAMEEAESDDLMQAMKWMAFRSRRYAPTNPSGFVVGAVMGLPAPAPVATRAAATSDARADLGRAEGRRGMKLGTKKKIKKKMPLILRRSPRFPRRSSRLLDLACSQGRG